MKICWDNLEKLRYNKDKDKWYDRSSCSYVYMESCKNCGEPFLSCRGNELWCSKSCVTTNRVLSVSTREKISKSHIGKKLSDEHKRKISKSHIGKKLSEEHKRKVSIGNKGKLVSEETKEKMSIAQRGDNNHRWKGGYRLSGLPMYETYAPQLEWCEEVRRNEDNADILEVKCTYCGRWFIPTISNTNNRLQVLKGSDKYNGEHHFYCSEQCKSECPIYHVHKYPKGSKHVTSREVQPELRQMVLAKDGYKCRRCGATDKPLHCHHIYPVSIDPIESADIDNCMTLCVDCHKEVHQKDGCRYNQLRTEVC
jgi:hypothetical protein